MYIKLTRFDNTPIWINAAFVVTVEPRRQNVGSIVVPIGDGLDYEVRESAEEVLAMLDGAPAATVVPVPPPKSLTEAPEAPSAEPAPVKEPRKRAAKKPASRKPRARKTEIVFPDEHIERLRRLAPGSVRKLANTISTQFNIEDADGVIDSLASKGVLTLDRDHVIWS